MEPVHIAFLVFPGMTQLDLVGPAQVLSRLGKVTIDFVAASLDPVPTDCGLSVMPTATYETVTRADILCVPGGMTQIDVMEDARALAWVRAIGEQAHWVTSVCTGSLVLAAAGLLTGYRAACHWHSRHQLAWFGAEPVADRVVIDRNRMTGGGVTAGIDFALVLTAAIRGEAHARLVQLSIEYDPAPPFDSGAPDKAMPETLSRFQQLAAPAAADREARVKAVAAAFSNLP